MFQTKSNQPIINNITRYMVIIGSRPGQPPCYQHYYFNNKTDAEAAAKHYRAANPLLSVLVVPSYTYVEETSI